MEVCQQLYNMSYLSIVDWIICSYILNELRAPLPATFDLGSFESIYFGAYLFVSV